MQHLLYPKIAPAGIAALRALEHYCNAETGLSPILLELVRLRASLLNGCEYCVGLHTHELEKHNEPAGRIGDVASWRQSDAYTATERAALAWTEAVTDIQQGHASDADYDAMRAHFDEKAAVDLTLAIVSINAWNRMAIAFRAEHTPKPAAGEQHEAETAPGAPAKDDDGGKVAED